MALMNGHSVRCAIDEGAFLAAAARSQARAAACRRAAFYHWSAPVALQPSDLLEAAQGLAVRHFYWCSRDRGEEILGVGTALRITAEGPDRFADSARAAADTGAPLLLGAFAFGDAPLSGPWRGFRPADWFVPRVLLRRRGTRTDLTLCGRSVPGGPPREPERTLRLAQALARFIRPAGTRARLIAVDPPAAGSRWRQGIAAAMAAIDRGELQKVILARRRYALAQRPIPAAAVVRALLAAQLDCAVFACAQGGRTFLGATPERLVRTERSRAFVDCIAGSMPRGQDAAQDESLGAALSESDKNRREHAFVVAAVVDALSRAGLTPRLPAAPSLLRLPALWHLYTPVQADLRPGVGLFELAGVLHPTPALGGLPRDRALAFIAEHEGFARGLYGGAVGWCDASGDGELMVAIRSGLLHGPVAQYFAGCGIVQDSDPEDEFAESCLKLRPLAAALREAMDG